MDCRRRTTKLALSPARLAPEMMARLIELGLTAGDERVASVCLVAGLDRAGVEPIDYDLSQDMPQPTWDPMKLTAEERGQLREILKKALGQGKAVRAPAGVTGSDRHGQQPAVASDAGHRARASRRQEVGVRPPTPVELGR